MKRIRPLFAASVILALATLLPLAVLSVEPAEVPGPPRDTSSAVIINMGLNSAAVFEICARVAAGEIVEGIAYDCTAYIELQERCADPERASVDCFPDATPVPNTCWDCPGSTYTWAEARVWYCSAERVRENPLIVDECWPDKWEWVCFPDGHCEMYRQDLDPLGIFATPPPMPTPEPLPTPVPTATPEPTPENPATATP